MEKVCIYCEDPIHPDGLAYCPFCHRPVHRNCLNEHIEYWADDPELHKELIVNPPAQRPKTPPAAGGNGSTFCCGYGPKISGFLID